MSERQSRRVRQEIRKRFRTDFDEFTSMICGFSVWFRMKFCIELLFGRWWKKMKSKIKREKKRGDR